ncbi:MAG: zinc-dependent metalloprotease family protein [Candidatus Heimdallarchaeota archaeon]
MLRSIQLDPTVFSTGGAYTDSPYGKTIVVSHEIGHNFGGDHPYAAKQLYVPPDYYYTACGRATWGMGGCSPTFSNGRIGSDPSKNNLKRMIPYACEYLPD